MPEIAQGIFKRVAYKKQAGRGTTSSGAGGQLLRRESATMAVTKDTYSSNEIVSHYQHTGDKYGIAKSSGSVNGLISGLTYSDFFSSLLKKAWVGTTAITAVSLTIAASGTFFTITRSAGSYLTDGIKVGDVVRITAGAVNAANLNKNLVVVALTATVMTVSVLNRVAMVAEGPIASCTISVPGKKIWVPTTGHTNDYYTIEEFYSDIPRSHVYPDVQVAKAELGLPPTGNATVAFSLLGLGARNKGAAQILTSPTSETTTEVLAAVNGAILIGGLRYLTATGISITIDGQMNHGDAVIGSNNITDIQKGDVKVSGSFSVLYDGDTISDYFDNETALNIIAVVSENDNANANFIALNMSQAKIFSDPADDGKKQIVRTYSFTAEINGAGGAALADLQTIVSIQDSLVP